MSETKPKHTPEPWRVLKLADTRFGPSFGILSPSPGPGRIDSQINGMTEENATRIVECVNAMSGIDDPAAFVKETTAHKLQENTPRPQSLEEITAELVALKRDQVCREALKGIENPGEFVEVANKVFFAAKAVESAKISYESACIVGDHIDMDRYQRYLNQCLESLSMAITRASLSFPSDNSGSTGGENGSS